MDASSPLEPSDAAAILARKAAEDATAVREFAANPEIADGIIGFHAQQAIEKWLKAVLASRGVDFEYTHDLRHLIALAGIGEDEAPFDLREAVDLMLECARGLAGSRNVCATLVSQWPSLSTRPTMIGGLLGD